MSGAKAPNPITPDKFDAVLFDFDGVLTATAKVHAICWKKMFDCVLSPKDQVGFDDYTEHGMILFISLFE